MWKGRLIRDLLWWWSRVFDIVVRVLKLVCHRFCLALLVKRVHTHLVTKFRAEIREAYFFRAAGSCSATGHYGQEREGSRVLGLPAAVKQNTFVEFPHETR